MIKKHHSISLISKKFISKYKITLPNIILQTNNYFLHENDDKKSCYILQNQILKKIANF